MARTSKQEALRRRAELLALEGRNLLDPPTPEANLQLLHELRVHQIELEMQNEELAPVGYCILSPKGLTHFANP